MSLPSPSSGDEPGSSLGLRPLYNLVYCSRARSGITDADVARIIESARRSNPVFGITGMLVFGGGVFFQWLEGPRENVLQLMSILRTDPRHHDVVLLSETEEMRERLFPDWDMELVSSDDIRDVLQDALDSASDDRNAAVLGRLLEQLDSGELSELSRA